MPWPPFQPLDRPPRWAVQLTRLVTELSEKNHKHRGELMAAIDDINTAVSGLKDAVTVALTDLANRADAGGLTGAEVRGVIADLNAEHDAVVAAVQAADNPAPAPAAPVADVPAAAPGDASVPTLQ